MRAAPSTHPKDLERHQRCADNMMPYDRTHDVTIRSRLATNFMIFLQLNCTLLSSTSSVTDEDHFWE